MKTDKEWIENWRRAGPTLEEIRRQELRNFNHEAQWEIVDALLQIGSSTPRRAPPADWSNSSA